MGPTSGGSIGSQGWRVPLLGLTCCTAVPAVHSDMPVWYGALYCTSPHLTGWHRSWIPYGTYFRRVHRISGYVGSCTWSRLLLCSTCSTQRYASMVWSIVLYLTWPSGPDRPGYHMGPTSGGSIGSQGWRDTSYLLSPTSPAAPQYLQYTGNAERHVAQASSSVPGLMGCHIAWDPM